MDKVSSVTNNNHSVVNAESLGSLHGRKEIQI